MSIGRLWLLSTNLIFLQEFELDDDIRAEPFVLVLMDLVLLLSSVNAGHGDSVSRTRTQLLQV